MKNTNQQEGKTQDRPSIQYSRLRDAFAGGRHILLALFFFCLATGNAGAQPLQQVRGTVVDAVLQTPVAGATVSLPVLGQSAVTDANGQFRFPGVPVGNVRVQAASVGYNTATLDNIPVNAGKETVLTIAVENAFREEASVVVKSRSRRNKPLNEMSVVSARAFTVEETQKYAAAVNDPARMAAGFPGVFATDDGNNSIAIRGNAPTGLLWRMEGVDIPNPNHFGATGSSGGGISILSAQLLSNSDFVTGAFAPEYGNALSGVFDLRLRKGNNERREFTLQAGLLGLNAAAEGPFRRSGYKGSYLVNYRYSTLQLLDKIGIPIEGAATNFKDLSYNFYLPTARAGTFTVFGFSGRSDQESKPSADSAKWEHRFDRVSGSFISNTDLIGVTHTVSPGGRSTLRSVASFSSNKIVDRYQYIQDDYSLREEYRDDFRTKKWTLGSTLSHKFSSRASLKAGITATMIGFRYFQRSRANEQAPLQDVINAKGATMTVQGFTQVQYRLAEALTVQGGIHYLHLLYNNTFAVEPRASLRWQAGTRDALAFGFGQHSQLQPLGVYFGQATTAGGTPVYPNKQLELSRARHYVLSWQHSLGRDLALKAETYYQQLFNIPVSAFDTSTFSVLNIQSDFITDPLVNKGTGRNYGLELSLEKYLSKSLYYTLSTSLFEAKYKALDGVERDTRFNGNYILSLMAGKEFRNQQRNRTFGLNIRGVYAGGLRRTPIDLERSNAAGYAQYREQEAFSQQNPAYFRTDLRLSLKWDKRRITSTLSLDVQNLTNRQNIAGQWYDSEQGKLRTSYQTGLIPVLNYKIEF
ncbi:MAG: TonB-dependent receptor [Chitinophagaceae bacterium]|nr:MAG: TonB-dependent receptor [Chitinophagaceae bacterium]